MTVLLDLSLPSHTKKGHYYYQNVIKFEGSIKEITGER